MNPWGESVGAHRLPRRAFVAGCATTILSGLVVGCADGLPNFHLPNPRSPAPNLTGRLAFVHGTSIVEWTDGTSRTVAQGQSFADPAWSPDGSLLAATLSGTNHSDIVILNRDGHVLRQLTRDRSNVSIQSSVWARKPAWSPDGSRIAFVTDRDKHDMSLWVVGASGGQPEPLVLEKPYSAGVDWPTWSPDGTRIAYTAFDDGPAEIREVNLKSRQERVIVKESGGALDPAWSPNGYYLAYVARSTTGDDLFVLSIANGRKDRLTQGKTCRSPVWSPSGKVLAVARLDADRFILEASLLTFGAGVAADATTTAPGATDVVAQSGVTWTT